MDGGIDSGLVGPLSWIPSSEKEKLELVFFFMFQLGIGCEGI